ncbi:MAG: DEAD/DEAH box helicase, partial [Promethearchaeota archaeon]
DIKKLKTYWKNEDPCLKVLEFPIKLKKRIIKEFLPKNNDIKQVDFKLIDSIAEQELKKISSWLIYEELQSKSDWIYREGCIMREIEYIKPYPQQRDALEFLSKNDYKGFLKMATGSGKTKAAILASYRLFNELNKKKINLLVVILVPDSYLVNQWYEELRLYTKNVIKCYSEYRNWKRELRTKISRLIYNSINHCYIVATIASFKYEIWENFIINKVKNKNIKVLLIADEAHTLGSPLGVYLLNKLRDFFNDQYKIGLSATPIREYDTEGTHNVLTFFSNENKKNNIFEFSLKEAQEKGILMKLKYFPIKCHLLWEEFEGFNNLTKKIGRKQALARNSEEGALELTKLLNLRANILKKAIDKLNKLYNLLQQLINDANKNNKILSKLVIFCKDREQVADVSSVISSINQNLDMRSIIRFNTVDGEDDIQIRKKRFNDLIENKINLLIVMKCLDRGVDIPSLEKAIFMSSSGTELEHIQRTGRLLRRAPNKLDPVEIYDLFIFPTINQIEENPSLSQKIFNIERNRIKFFMEISENKDEIQDLIWSLELYL